jgi:hypothetical protein
MVACDSEVSARPGADVFDRPLRDGHLFFIISQSGSCRILGYFHQLSAGLIFSNLRPLRSAIATSYVDAHGHLPDRGCI